MKKLFSIVLVIAMAVSCLAIFPAASITGTASLTHEISGDIVTFKFSGEANCQLLDGVTPIYDLWYVDGAEVLEFLGVESITATNMPSMELGVNLFVDADTGYCSIGGDLNYIDEATGAIATEVTWQCRINAEPGTEITLEEVEMYLGAYKEEIWVGEKSGTYTFVYEETGAEEPEDTTTEEPELPTYEAPAAAEYQTLAGCELCETPAGVRFIATVDAAADAFGMYITSGDKTVKLSSTDAGFKVKAETADTITFTAVIFSDLTFTVEVFEVYGETEVKSVAGTN